MNNSESEYVSVSKAAHLLGISVDTLRRWEKAGKLSANRLDGRNRHFLLTDVLAFVESRPLTTGQAAKLLGVSGATVRRLEANKVLQASKDAHGKRFFDSKALEAYKLKQSGQEHVAVTVGATTEPTMPVTEVEVVATPTPEPQSQPLKKSEPVVQKPQPIEAATHHAPHPVRETTPTVEHKSTSTPVVVSDPAPQPMPKPVIKVAIKTVEPAVEAAPRQSLSVHEAAHTYAKPSKPSRRRGPVRRHYRRNQDVYKAFTAFVVMVGLIIWLVVSG